MNDGSFNFAIDLGATCAKMACCHSGTVEIVLNREGANQTPCAVWLNPHENLVVGRVAKEALSTDASNVKLSFISDLGSDAEYEFPRSARRMKSEELTAELLKSMRLDAEQFAGREIRSVVITVPPNAGVAACEATKRAASNAGFTNCVLLQDAVAAAIGNGATAEAPNRSLLIYDFGGTRFDASILRIRDGAFQVAAHRGDRFLGGADLDRAVVKANFIPALQAAHPAMDISVDSPKAHGVFVKLQAEAEAAKIRLDQATETSVSISHLGEDNRGASFDFRCDLTCAHLEILAAPFVERSIEVCTEVLAEAHLSVSEVSSMIPVGGMAAMPFVRQKLQESFGAVANQLPSLVDPATAVARGAAIFGASQIVLNESHAFEKLTEFKQLLTCPSDDRTRKVIPHESLESCSEHSQTSRAESFPEDDWEMIVAAQQPDSPARSTALNKLISTYYPFVIRCLKSEKHSPEEVQDLAQGFFLYFVESDAIRKVHPARGSFRNFLRAVLRSYVTDIYRVSHAQKRGGGRVVESLDDMVERMVDADAGVAFDSALAGSLLHAAADDLRKEMTARGEQRIFDEMASLLTKGEQDNERLSEIAGEMGISERGLRNTIARSRKRFAELFREKVADVVSAEDVDEELRYLTSLLANCELTVLFPYGSFLATQSGAPPIKGVTKAGERTAVCRRPEAPTSRIDKVHFSVASPPAAPPAQKFIVDVWAHLERQRAEVERRVQQARPQTDAPPVIRPQGPFKIERGTTLFVRLRFTDLHVEPQENVILWEGQIGNTSFEVAIPSETTEGVKCGLVTVHWEGGLQIANIPLQVIVFANATRAAPTMQPLHNIRKAFASYASDDREEVLISIQGMQKVAPDLKVFYDEANLRSGSNWEQELKRVIPENDILYLFWSAAAKASRWVEMEWRYAFNCRGIGFIDPVPLVSPEDVPPPEELSGKHFKDWVLAYRRRSAKASE